VTPETRPGSFKRRLSLLLYYGFAKFLPGLEFPLGGLWRAIRAACVGGFIQYAGERIDVEPRVYLADGRYVRIGDHCEINAGTQIFGADIGNDVMLGPEVIILCRNHEFRDPDQAPRLQGESQPEPPVIEDGAWLGARVIVLPGRRIGTGAVVGAGSVVSRDVEPYSVVAGNPAAVIGSRRAELAR
jgi:maltose O-acetyltransferase